MHSELNTEDIEYFFIRLYFDTSKDLMHAAMQRAYRDFNRTIINIPKELSIRTEWRYKLYDTLRHAVNEVLNTNFNYQREFDLWHKSTCEELIQQSSFILTVGQAQKWVNMTLKYLFSFGEKRIERISANYHLYHVPIDNIIQNAFHSKYNIPKFPVSWSRIKDYEMYMNYQLLIRQNLNGKIPMDVEFRLFNTLLK